MRASQPRRATAIPFVGVLRVGTPSINSPRFNWVSTGFQLWGSTTGVQPHSKYSTTALTVRATSSSYNIELLHHGLDCGVKQWVYSSVATKLCCSGALLCGAVTVLCGAVWCCVVLYCCVTVVAPSSNYNTSCYTTGLTPEGILRGCVLLGCHGLFQERTFTVGRGDHAGEDVTFLIRSTNRSSLVWSSVCSAP